MIAGVMLYLVMLAITLLLARKKDRLTYTTAILSILLQPFALVWAIFALDISEEAMNKLR